jgi:hypothetical protein
MYKKIINGHNETPTYLKKIHEAEDSLINNVRLLTLLNQGQAQGKKAGSTEAVGSNKKKGR